MQLVSHSKYNNMISYIYHNHCRLKMNWITCSDFHHWLAVVSESANVCKCHLCSPHHLSWPAASLISLPPAALPPPRLRRCLAHGAKTDRSPVNLADSSNKQSKPCWSLPWGFGRKIKKVERIEVCHRFPKHTFLTCDVEVPSYTTTHHFWVNMEQNSGIWMTRIRELDAKWWWRP